MPTIPKTKPKVEWKKGRCYVVIEDDKKQETVKYTQGSLLGGLGVYKTQGNRDPEGYTLGSQAAGLFICHFDKEDEAKLCGEVLLDLCGGEIKGRTAKEVMQQNFTPEICQWIRECRAARSCVTPKEK